MTDETLDTVVERFKPEAVVCQCGADGVSGDPHQVHSKLTLPVLKQVHV